MQERIVDEVFQVFADEAEHSHHSQHPHHSQHNTDANTDAVEAPVPLEQFLTAKPKQKKKKKKRGTKNTASPTADNDTDHTNHTDHSDANEPKPKSKSRRQRRREAKRRAQADEARASEESHPDDEFEQEWAFIEMDELADEGADEEDTVSVAQLLELAQPELERSWSWSSAGSALSPRPVRLAFRSMVLTKQMELVDKSSLNARQLKSETVAAVVWLSVFSYLDLPSRQTCAAVCRDWNLVQQSTWELLHRRRYTVPASPVFAYKGPEWKMACGIRRMHTAGSWRRWTSSLRRLPSPDGRTPSHVSLYQPPVNSPILVGYQPVVLHDGYFDADSRSLHADIAAFPHVLARHGSTVYLWNLDFDAREFDSPPLPSDRDILRAHGFERASESREELERRVQPKPLKPTPHQQLDHPTGVLLGVDQDWEHGVVVTFSRYSFAVWKMLPSPKALLKRANGVRAAVEELDSDTGFLFEVVFCAPDQSGPFISSAEIALGDRLVLFSEDGSVALFSLADGAQIARDVFESPLEGVVHRSVAAPCIVRSDKTHVQVYHAGESRLSPPVRSAPKSAPHSPLLYAYPFEGKAVVSVHENAAVYLRVFETGKRFVVQPHNRIGVLQGKPFESAVAAPLHFLSPHGLLLLCLADKGLIQVFDLHLALARATAEVAEASARPLIALIEMPRHPLPTKLYCDRFKGVMMHNFTLQHWSWSTDGSPTDPIVPSPSKSQMAMRSTLDRVLNSVHSFDVVGHHLLVGADAALCAFNLLSSFAHPETMLWKHYSTAVRNRVAEVTRHARAFHDAQREEDDDDEEDDGPSAEEQRAAKIAERQARKKAVQQNRRKSQKTETKGRRAARQRKGGW